MFDGSSGQLVAKLIELGLLKEENQASMAAKGLATVEAMTQKKLTRDEIEALQKQGGLDFLGRQQRQPNPSAPNPMKLFATNGAGGNGGEVLGYSTKSAGPAVHRKSGQPAHALGHAIEAPSEFHLACLGVWTRYTAMKSGIFGLGMGIRPLDGVELDLLDYIFSAETKWAGDYGGYHHEALPGSEVRKAFGFTKDLIHESSGSGGSFLNPIFWDNSVITAAILTGELLPHVDIVDMPRANQVDTALVNRPSGTWGAADGTAITLFSTTGLVEQIQATVREYTIGLRIGLNLLSDSPVAIGSIVSGMMGEEASKELDRVIAVGVPASSEPEGLFTASGTTAAPSEGAGIITLGDIESLLFSCPKQYRQAGSFVGNDTVFARSMGLARGPGDAQRLLQMQYSNYASFGPVGHRYAVQNDIVNTKLAFGPLKKAYRLGRRAGASIRWTTEGQTLSLANEGLMILRGRYAGKVVLPEAISIMTGLPA